MNSRHVIRRAVMASLLAATGALALPGSASAAPLTVPLLCPVDYNGETYVLNYSRGYEVTAPSNVKPNQMFTVSYDPEPINPRTEFNTKAWDVTFTYNLPAGTKVIGYALTGGYNLKDSKQTVSFSPGRVALTATGPFTAGEDADVPTLNVLLRAPATEGVVTTSVAGTSKTDTGFIWTAEDPTTFEVGQLPCYPDPANPVVLSRTTVG
ncbi:hypothetical protein [Streptomyces thermolineatus]|uniref:hypothetical protein n=1 Tax=Streptomyces thermolineatus TaxID=44033 RepID=UPI00384E7C9D